MHVGVLAAVNNCNASHAIQVPLHWQCAHMREKLKHEG